MVGKLTNSPRKILFLRPVRLPVGASEFLEPDERRGQRSGCVGPHTITVFWIGFGRHPRLPGAALSERLRSGASTDVVDIGIAGALALLVSPFRPVTVGSFTSVRPGRVILQSRVRIGTRSQLIRVFADVDVSPAQVVTAYRTSKIDKYWSQQ
jgi:hypothetical protein